MPLAWLTAATYESERPVFARQSVPRVVERQLIL
jgi:hypothetical protein